MLRSVVRVGVIVGVAVGMIALANPASAAVDTSRRPRVLVGTGSDTLFEAMGDLDQLYNQSPGCAIIPAVGTTFTTYQQTCIDGGQLTYASDYADLISSENLYHDMFVEGGPVGSGNGTKILTQYVQSGSGTAMPVDYARASSKQTYAVANYTAYGVAYARDGASYWIGKNNTHVAQTASGVANPDASLTNLTGVFVGTGGGNCLTDYSTNPGDSIAATTGAPGSGNIDVFATQVGSGSGKDFLQKIDPANAATYTDASALQNCIKAVYKDGDQSNGEHVIQENFAGPICNQAGATTSFRKTAIFPYAFSRFVQNDGGAGTCAGVLGRVAGVKPSLTSISQVSGTGSYPMGSYRYNYFLVPQSTATPAPPAGFDVADPTTWNTLEGTSYKDLDSVLEYLSPVDGWLCKNSTQHAIDPVTGKNIRTLIAGAMRADGLSPLPLAAVGGSTFVGQSYCRDASAT